MLWLDESDRRRVGNEIIATIPANWDSDTNEHEEPSDPLEQQLVQHAKTKQTHFCRPPNEPGCRSKGTCK